MRFNNAHTAVILVLITLLSGCASQVRRAEPIKVELPEAKLQQRVYNEGTHLAFKQAVDLLQLDELELAKVALEDLLKQQSDIPGAWYNLALLQYNQNQPEQAQQSLARCTELSPRHAQAYTLSGMIHRQLGQFEQARLAYAKALESDRNYPQAHLNLAILYDIYLRYFEDAKQHYLRYLELDPDSEQSAQVLLWLQDLEFRIAQENQG